MTIWFCSEPPLIFIMSKSKISVFHWLFVKSIHQLSYYPTIISSSIFDFGEPCVSMSRAKCIGMGYLGMVLTKQKAFAYIIHIMYFPSIWTPESVLGCSIRQYGEEKYKSQLHLESPSYPPNQLFVDNLSLGCFRCNSH